VRSLLSGIVALLVTIGVLASVARGLFLSDLGARIELSRARVLGVLGSQHPSASDREAEVARFDRRFARHPTTTLLHIVPGGLFLLLAPIQFSARMRSRHLEVHRWSGRFLALAALITAATGLHFGLFMPFAGPRETVPIALFSLFLVYAIGKGVVAVRKGQFDRHREWMIRAYALGLAISTVRIFAAALDLVATPAGLGAGTAFVIAIWAGWLATLGVGESWIRSSRLRLP
jgi:uncharacterized membrane protein